MTETRHGFDVECPVPYDPDRARPPSNPDSSFRQSRPSHPVSSSFRTDQTERLWNQDSGHKTSDTDRDVTPHVADALSLNEPEDNGASQSSAGVIHHLIVTVKAPHTVNALKPLVHRLTSASTILLLQNGMGIIDEINAALFPDPQARPHYMVGIVSHGLYGTGTGSFETKHAGEGTIALGLMPPISDASENPQSPERSPGGFPASAGYLLRTMTRTPVFVAVGFHPTDLLQQQLDKLAVNAVINPLTALFECSNSKLLRNHYMRRTFRLMIAEISVVFRSLPELRHVPNKGMRFSTQRLEELVLSIAKATGNNRSSMLQDVQDNRQTEIDYINGYVVKRGEEMGIHCVTNYMIMQMIKAKEKLKSLDAQGLVIPMKNRRLNEDT